jgi:dTMP kinase
MKGKFVVIEGLDGAGGELQSKKLIEYLKSKNTEAVRLSYPDYQNPIGKTIKEFLDKRHELTPEMQVILYGGDMVKDSGRIGALLERGAFVVTDRYFTSTLAYQVANGFPMESALKFAEIFGLFRPDAVIYLKISPETSMERKFKENNQLDRYEKNGGFLGKVAKQYEELAKGNVLGTWHIVDGEKSIEDVSGQIRRILKV